MKAILYVFCCVALLYSCSGCGSTIRLDYDGGKSGTIGIGITLPKGYSKDPMHNPEARQRYYSADSGSGKR